MNESNFVVWVLVAAPVAIWIGSRFCREREPNEERKLNPWLVAVGVATLYFLLKWR